MSYQAIMRRYLRNLQREYNDAISGNQHTAELSFRPQLHVLFRELSVELSGSPDIVVVFEPRNQARMGHPDWRFHDRNTHGVLGYIEAKGLSATTLDVTSHENQISRYLSLGHKLIITDGIDFFCSFDDNVEPQYISLFDKAMMRRPDWSQISINPQFRLVMEVFFSDPAPQYCDEGRLVELIALRTRVLSDDILNCTGIPYDEALNETERNAINLLSELRTIVYNHNDPNMRNDQVFADFAAQIIMFTILYAHRVECTDADSPMDKERKIRAFLSRSEYDNNALRPFLKIVHYLNDWEGNENFILSWTDECIRFLSFVHMTDRQRQSPDYHKLFELFHSKFDPQSRFDYGVYYTPKELADFVIRVVETIVRQSFYGASIFDDANTIIDPCCGTGSFLERIKRNDTSHGSFTLCGFEILPAPYMLANYRISTLDHELEGESSRCELALANTLSNYVIGDEPANADTVEGFELNLVRELSSRPITLVIGNPPSSDSAKSNTDADCSIIRALMNDFRPPAEYRRIRQNTQKQTNNPYLQFLRWGCEILERSNNHSVLAFIVPATFLEHESYKYARKYITEHFSSAWVVSVDADARAGIRSDSMFKTLQGRAILIAIRRFGETTSLNEFKFFDVSRFAKSEKAEWLEQDAATALLMFSCHDIDVSSYALRPSLPFDETLYASYWPVAEGAEQKPIFNKHCSGVKLAPSCLFTHVKAPMLKRRSRDIMLRGLPASVEWLGTQDKPPKEDKARAFANALNELGDVRAVDAALNNSITDYAFRPFLPVKAFLWQDLLHRFNRIGGGGTRRRPEIVNAFSDEHTVGLALSHSPKDQKDSLKQFASFCWYHPDNDLCRRGNSFIYLNQYPADRRGNILVSNINDRLAERLSALLGVEGVSLSSVVVFYTFAVLCSQVYLDEFEGALYTVNRADMRPRIPIVDNTDIFSMLADLGRKIAELEMREFAPDNLAGYDYDAIKAQVPPNFRLSWTKAIQPFDEDNETVTLTDGYTNITIPCPLDVQRLSVGGYEIIKNVWMKFNSYNFTHCDFTSDDIEGFLNLINKLLVHVVLVGEIDNVMHDIIDGRYPLISPINDCDYGD